ncbi:unnamed protein product [Cladocopium goreaui]|uniref:Uncharacterized protein n=1 Tax=Cladocopium goreaui TaxID=2562237 RepID=A0A9P1CPA3_9DINO|nr:unnamed protein product [Cladocopium goreaui]
MALSNRRGEAVINLFDLQLAPDGDLDPRPVGYEDFCKQESAFITVDDDITVQSDEEELFDDDDGAPGPPRQRPRLDLSPHLDFVERPELDVSPTPTTPLDDTDPAMDLEAWTYLRLERCLMLQNLVGHRSWWKMTPMSHHDHLQCDLRHKCLLWTLPLWRCMSQLAQMIDFDFYDNNMNDMKPWCCPPDQELIALALDIELIQVKLSRLPLLRIRGLLLLVNLMRDSMRQQLADKLRHGRIKFLYDPNYVAAKKKSLEEKKHELESRNTKRKKPQSELRIIKEELEASEDVEMIENDLAPTNALVSDFEQVPTNDLTPKNAQLSKNDMVSQYAKVPAETYFAQSTEPLVYVDMVQNALTPLAMDAPVARCWWKNFFKLVMVIWWLMKLPGASAAPMAMCLTEHEEVKTESSKSWESIFLVLAILALCCAGIYVWKLRADQLRLQRQIDNLEGDLHHGNHRSNVLVVMYDELRGSYDRRTTAYDRARRAFVEQRAAAQELQGALALATQDLGAGYQAQMDVRQHVRRCPLGDEIHIQDGSSVWHRDDECDELYDSGREIRIFQPCAVCSRQDLVVPGDDAMQFFDEHGVRVVNAPPGMQFTWRALRPQLAMQVAGYYRMAKLG